MGSDKNISEHLWKYKYGYLGIVLFFLIYYNILSIEHNIPSHLNPVTYLRNYKNCKPCNCDQSKELDKATEKTEWVPNFYNERLECPKQYEITIVTAFFYKANRSKHSLKDYEKWMSKFLPKVVTPMVIFTEPQFASLLGKQRQGLPTIIRSEYQDVWDLPFLKENGLKEKYFQLHSIDPERRIHSPELYAIWNSKAWMVSQIAQLNPFNSSYFFWNDVGTYREIRDAPQCFPSLDKVKSVFSGDNQGKINLFAVDKFRNYKNGNNIFEDMVTVFIFGGFFGGMKSGIKWYSEAFYAAHDRFLSQGKFVGKDQTLQNWVVVQNPEHVILSCPCQGKVEGCSGDRIWFYFQQFYNPSGKERDENTNCKIEMFEAANGSSLLLTKN